ncbi:MAG: DUF4097 family beta strand repeat protein [Nocardioidaceae bacterium]|nr:DUF4097 family beta strand repeat protein [Nocardioidaceae bacterium]NUS49924.1 DUF4097 family beta strand repeat protein [Nocardioidaceae bacterium]
MPTFATPEPITATIEPGVGYVTLVASDRADTVVDVRPTNPDSESDVDAAARTTVDFAGGTLTVKGPRINPFSWSGKTRSIDITVALPAGSHVHGHTGMGDLNATGRLGDVTYKTGFGHVQLDEVAALSVTSATGNVLGNRITGKATIKTAGRLYVGELGDSGMLKNSNGATVVGTARGPVTVRAANGDITVEEAGDDVEAKTATGAVRVLDAGRGSLTLETSVGEIEVGIREGSAAWLDVRTKFGRVRNEMTASGPPADQADKVEVHATTSVGDVIVRRA